MNQGAFFMKKIGFILILFLIIPTAAIAKDEDANELEAMAAFVADNDLTIESWEVTIKEKVKQDQLQAILENLKDSHLVSTTEDENAIKYKLRSTHKNARSEEHTSELQSRGHLV